MNDRYFKPAIALLTFALVSLLPACQEAEDNAAEAVEFDRLEMLANVADNIVIPAYGDLATKSGSLQTAVDAFADAPDVTKLAAAREAWTNAYMAWQYASTYDFGPAESGFGTLPEEIGVFPADEAAIESFVDAGDASLNNFDRDTQGFLALEYLLFAEGESETVAAFADADRAAYLTALAEQLTTKINAVAQGWNSYRSTFVSDNGTDAGSATSLLYNAMVSSFEVVKNFKVGLPAGKRPGQTAPEPERVEALHSEQSATYMTAHLAAVEALWHGQGLDGTDGPGFREYVLAVEGGQALVDDTEASWADIRAALAELAQDDLSKALQDDPQAVDALHTELTEHTRFIKADLSSLLGLAITFESGDGD